MDMLYSCKLGPSLRVGNQGISFQCLSNEAMYLIYKWPAQREAAHKGDEAM